MRSEVSDGVAVPHNNRPHLYVCVSCRCRGAEPAPEGEPTDGRRLYEAVKALAALDSETVAAVDANGVQGATSAGVNGTTTGSQPPPPTCYTASNYAHTTAGRAHQSGGYTYANGSNQNMGLWNTFTTTTLKMTGTNFYVIGTCP